MTALEQEQTSVSIATVKRDVLQELLQVKNDTDKIDLDTSESMGINIVMDYFNFENHKDMPLRFIYMGSIVMELLDKQTGALRALEHIILMDKSKKMWSYAGIKLVSTIKDRKIPAGTALEITYLGTVKTKSGGNMHTFSVVPLIPKL